MNYKPTLAFLGIVLLFSLPSRARPTDCSHLFTVIEIDAVVARTVNARDAANRALGDGGALREEVERLIRHLDLAITGVPDDQIDGLDELRDFYMAHPASPGHLFGGVNRVIGRLQLASQIAANVTVGRGPATPVTPRLEAWHQTTQAFEQLSALWRPISQCKIEFYL